MDAILLNSTTRELNDTLTGHRIEKIHQPKNYEIYLKIKSTNLLISIHPTLFRMHLSNQKYDNPISPPMFTMVLRKHLTNGVIQSIEMDELERIVTLNITNRDEMLNNVSFKLICELMGKHSNIILVNSENIIIDSIKRIPHHISSVRTVLPGENYNRPPKNPNVPTIANLSTLDVNSITGINSHVKEEITKGNLTIDNLINSIKNPTPNIVYKDDKPYYICSAIINNTNYKTFSTLSEAIQNYYLSKQDNIQNIDIIKNINTIILRDKRTLETHKKTLLETGEKHQLYGELLTSYCHSLKDFEKSAKVLNYYTNEQIEIPLDSKLSIINNAKKFYKRYSKIKNAKIHAQEQIGVVEQRIEYLLETVSMLKNASSNIDVEQIKQELSTLGFMRKKGKKQKSKPLPPIKYKTSSGNIVLVGRNSSQNDELTTKKAKHTDLWFHTKDIHGSHVILQGENPDDESILQSAQIAAYHSDARLSQNVPVDYTYIKYVKKPAHSMPGKVIFTNQKTIYVTPDHNMINEMRLKQ